MRANDGKLFSISHNYASKSRLVQGDILMLHITPEGKYRYKQVEPTRRKRTGGVLEHDPERSDYVVHCPDGAYRVLPASVTYFKGVPGDIVQCIVPADGPCQWAAVEGIKKNVINQKS